MLHIFSVDVVSFSLCPKRAACGLQAQLNSPFVPASLQMCKVDKASPNTKSTDESGWMGGEAAGVCGVWGELWEEVTEGGGSGSPSKL